MNNKYIYILLCIFTIINCQIYADEIISEYNITKYIHKFINIEFTTNYMDNKIGIVNECEIYRSFTVTNFLSSDCILFIKYHLYNHKIINNSFCFYYDKENVNYDTIYFYCDNINCLSNINDYVINDEFYDTKKIISLSDENSNYTQSIDTSTNFDIIYQNILIIIYMLVIIFVIIFSILFLTIIILYFMRKSILIQNNSQNSDCNI